MSNTPRIIAITGANKGIGLAIINRLLATAPPTPPLVIYLLARDRSRGEAALNEVQSSIKGDHQVKFGQLDVTAQDSIDACKKQIEEEQGKVSDLISSSLGVNVLWLTTVCPLTSASILFRLTFSSATPASPLADLDSTRRSSKVRVPLIVFTHRTVPVLTLHHIRSLLSQHRCLQGQLLRLQERHPFPSPASQERKRASNRQRCFDCRQVDPHRRHRAQKDLHRSRERGSRRQGRRKVQGLRRKGNLEGGWLPFRWLWDEQAFSHRLHQGQHSFLPAAFIVSVSRAVC
jgi:hypothetical protein